MKRCLVLVLALPLMSCAADQQQQLAKCVFEAEQEYQSETWLYDESRQSFVWLCMAANGYRLNRQHEICSRAFTPTGNAVLYAQCYEPIGTTARLIYSFEKMIGRTSNR